MSGDRLFVGVAYLELVGFIGNKHTKKAATPCDTPNSPLKKNLGCALLRDTYSQPINGPLNKNSWNQYCRMSKRRWFTVIIYTKPIRKGVILQLFFNTTYQSKLHWSKRKLAVCTRSVQETRDDDNGSIGRSLGVFFPWCVALFDLQQDTIWWIPFTTQRRRVDTVLRFSHSVHPGILVNLKVFVLLI